MTPAVQQFAISAGKCIVPQPSCKNHGFGCYVVHKKQRVAFQPQRGGVCRHVGFRISGYCCKPPKAHQALQTPCQSLGYLTEVQQQQAQQSGSVLVWQCVGCTAACSPKQSRVISEFPRRVNILEAALLVPVSAAFSTAYRGQSLCWLHMLAGAPRLPEPFFARLGHPVLRLGSPGSMRVPAHVADGCSPCKTYRIRVFLASSRKERRSTSACVLEGHMLCNVH